MNPIAKKIFDDIELLIKICLSDKPVRIGDSRFIRELKKLKERYE